MKKVLLGCTLIFSFSCGYKKPDPKVERKISSAFFQDSQSYCVSIRGNGQRMPSLWGALARTIESYGPPSGMSGGSSATYSMFLTESILMNPHYSVPKDSERFKEQASFLVKSLMGWVNYLGNTKLLKNALSLKDDPKAKATLDNLMAQMKGSKDAGFLKKTFGKIKLAFAYLTDSRTRKIAYLFGHNDTKLLMNKELFEDYLNNPKGLEKLNQVLDDPEVSDQDKKGAVSTFEKQMQYRNQEFSKALGFFANYDTKNNANMFFRPGPMNFLGFATLFNRAASFYAGIGFDDKLERRFAIWLDKCSKNTKGKLWSEAIKKGSWCERRYNSMMKHYFEIVRDAERGYRYVYQRSNRPHGHRSTRRERVKEPFSLKWRFDDNVGQNLMIIPTTGVILGEAVERFNQQEKDFEKTLNPDFGYDYHVSLDELKVGYWGEPETMDFIQSRLNHSFQDSNERVFDFSNDFKSNLFYSLGKAKWKDVFVTSPVEPSLSKIARFNNHDDALSIGGWMDHLSAPVLKAAGCPNVVTITKRDGMGKFATGMLKRILKLDEPTWEEMEHISKTGKSDDTESIWSRYLNMANPDSSFNTGLKTADAIVCANYDAVDFMKLGPKALFVDGYKAPIVFHPKVDSDHFLRRENGYSSIVTTKDNKEVNGQRPYVSCFPKSY